jgi:UDP-glucose 4-epimerase
MNRVLVTGGLGVIGAFVCRALLAGSRQPVIYDMGGDTGLIRDIAADCVIERGDVCDLPRLMGVASQHKPAAIVHLAGQVSPGVEQFPWSSLNANLIGTTTVLECARLSGIQRIVFSSSRQVYGPVAERHRHPTYEPVPEEHPREPRKFYGKLKRVCEDVADHYAQLYGLDIIALRCASAFGPGKFGRRDKVSPVMGLIEAAIAHRPFRIDCGAEQGDDLCYSGESANGVMAALDSAPFPGKFRAYNIAADELISLRGMIAVLEDLHPGWSAEAGPGLDYRRVGPGYYFKMATEKARAEIGFVPRFDFRRAAIDYGETLGRLKQGIS